MNLNKQKLLNAYSAFATFFLLSHDEIKGEIIYTDIVPDETYSTNGDEYLVDLNNDGVTDFSINIIDISSSNVFFVMSEYYSALIQNVFILPTDGNAIAGSIVAGSYFSLMP